MTTPHAKTLRTWDNGKRCDECCNGDRCDDPSHYDRKTCPHCKGTGWALWTEAGRNDFAEHLKTRQKVSESYAREVIAGLTWEVS